MASKGRLIEIYIFIHWIKWPLIRKDYKSTGAGRCLDIDTRDDDQYDSTPDVVIGEQWQEELITTFLWISGRLCAHGCSLLIEVTIVLQMTSRLKLAVEGPDRGESRLFEKSRILEAEDLRPQDALEGGGEGRDLSAGRFAGLVRPDCENVLGRGLGGVVLVAGCSGPKEKRLKEKDVTSEMGLRRRGLEASPFEVSAGVRMLTTYSRRGETAFSLFFSSSSCSGAS